MEFHLESTPWIRVKLRSCGLARNFAALDSKLTWGQIDPICREKRERTGLLNVNSTACRRPFLTTAMPKGAVLYMPLNRRLNGRTNRTASRPRSRWLWAFGKREKIVGLYPVRRCLEVFISGRGLRNDHVEGISPDVDIEVPIAPFHPSDCIRLHIS